MSSSTEYTNAFSKEDAIRTATVLLICLLSVFGTIGNICLLMSIAVEDHLKKAGNTFIMNVALVDLLIASIFMPISAITLANKEESTLLCNIKWFIAEFAFLATVISVTALENYVRLCRPDRNVWFNMQTTAKISAIVWVIAIVATALQYTFDFKVNFCTNKSNDDIIRSVFSLLVLFPLLVTCYIHMRISIDVKNTTIAPDIERDLETDSYLATDVSLARTNFYSFLIFIIFWLPFAVVFYYQTIGDVTNEIYYVTAWIGLSKSCFHNIIYCTQIDHFRAVYVRCPDYCTYFSTDAPMNIIIQHSGNHSGNNSADYEHAANNSTRSVPNGYYLRRHKLYTIPDYWERYDKYSKDLLQQERRKERPNQMVPFRANMPLSCLNVCREVD